MPHHFGYRMGTRHMFARGFRKHGTIGLSTYLTTYKVGDLVDIKVNGAQQKGMPHKTYHGRTGVVFNVNKRGLGIEVNKKVRHRILRKKISIRIEHVKKSKCRDAFVARVKKNDALKAEAKKNGVKVDTKRQIPGPRPGFTVKPGQIEDIAPLRHEDLF